MTGNFRLRTLHYLFLIALCITGGCSRAAATHSGAGEGQSGAAAGADTLGEMMRQSKRQYGKVDGIVERLAATDITAILKASDLGSLQYSDREFAELDPRQREQISEEMDDLNQFFRAVSRRGVELATEARREGNAELATRYVRMLERAGLALQARDRMAFIRDLGKSLSRAANDAAG